MIWDIISPPRHGEGFTVFMLQFPGFPDKVIHDPDFLHLLAVHLLDLANQNPADKPVQHRLVQFLNGGVGILIY